MLIPTKPEILKANLSQQAWRKDFVVRGAVGQTSIQRTTLYNLARFLGFMPYVGNVSCSVYVLKCRTPRHWYVGMTSRPTFRFESHAQGVGSLYTTAHGIEAIWEVFTVHTRAEAVDLERTVFGLLKEIHPDFCISMGMLCLCKKEAY